jgi:membrane protease YdiL (CAAX protease family)
MEKETFSQKVFSFFLTKIIIGILVIVAPVWLIESAGRWFLEKFTTHDELINGIISIAASAAAIFSYVFLFRFYESRKIVELNPSEFLKNAILGFLTGLALQSLFIFILYLADHYRILAINPLSYLMPALIMAVTAGFVAELIIRGIVFRITEEKFGTTISVLFMTILFGILHSGSKGANVISVVATSAEAGFLLSAAYVFARNLWLPIFLHIAWDFAEPGIFGGINPGNSVNKSLFTSEISGPIFLTGGEAGPQNSLQAAIFCLLAGFIFLWLAKRKNNFIPFKPSLS